MDKFPGPADVFVGVAVFLAGWIYAVVAYGFFLGGGLGWLPAIFLAIIATLIWRIVALIAIIAGLGIGAWLLLSK